MTISELQIKVMKTKEDEQKRKKTAENLYRHAAVKGCERMTMLQLHMDVQRQYKAYDSASMILGQLDSGALPTDKKFIEIVKQFFEIKDDKDGEE